MARTDPRSTYPIQGTRGPYFQLQPQVLAQLKAHVKAQGYRSINQYLNHLVREELARTGS